MNEKISKRLVPMTMWGVGLGLIIVVIVVGAYVFKFASAASFELSTDPEAWSFFGGYLGGVLGPLFAFLAFVAVLFTVWLQAKQLEDAESRSHIEELQRVMASLSVSIDGLLVGSPNSKIGFAALDMETNVKFVLIVVGN